MALLLRYSKYKRCITGNSDTLWGGGVCAGVDYRDFLFEKCASYLII